MSVNVAGKKILIISGGVEALPIIEKAIKMGLYVLVSDGDRSAPGLALAHEAIIASTYDAEKTLELARATDPNRRISGVISAAADVPRTVALVADALGLPGPSPRSALLAGNKFLMKMAFKDMGLAVPWFAMINGPDDLKALARGSAKAFVVKPVDSRGARGVIRLTKDVDLGWAFFEAKKNSPSGAVMAEEWIDGIQLSTESVVAGGSVATPGLSERNYEYIERFSPYVIENGGDLPARLEEHTLSAVNELILGAACAFGFDDWTIKGDIVLSDKGPVIIEAAPRLSGGYFCTHTIPLSSGVDIVEAAILLALGIKVSVADYNPDFTKFISQRFWFPEEGLVKEVRRNSGLESMAGLEMMRLHVREGDTISPMVSHPSRAGMVITSGRSREEAGARAVEAISGVRIITEKPLRMAR